jgi:hypothetical protein
MAQLTIRVGSWISVKLDRNFQNGVINSGAVMRPGSTTRTLNYTTMVDAVVCAVSEVDINKNVVESFTALVRLIDRKRELKKGIAPIYPPQKNTLTLPSIKGYKPTVDVGTGQVRCEFTELLQLLNQKTGEHLGFLHSFIDICRSGDRGIPSLHSVSYRPGGTCFHDP